ncbi:MAG: protease inhibitor I42 family protein [Ferruginibacter sp.]
MDNFINKLMGFVFFFLIHAVCFGQDSTQQYIPRHKIKVKKNKQFNYEIPSNLGNGYSWTLSDTTNIKILEHSSRSNKVSSEFSDIEVFKLVCLRKGKYLMTFYYSRVFDKDKDISKLKKIHQKIIVK